MAQNESIPLSWILMFVALVLGVTVAALLFVGGSVMT
jgi:hypothetical protein